MTFQEELKAIKNRVEGNMPPKFLKVMHGATKELEESDIQDHVLQKGSKAPEFNLPDQNESIRSLNDYLNSGPLVLTFYRGFWCPYCNADLANLNRYQKEIESLGGSLIAISPELPKYSKKIINTQHIHFDLLHDLGNEIASEFGVRFNMPKDLIELYRNSFNINLRVYNADNSWTLPMPSRFLIDREGVIQYAESKPDYRERPDPDEVIDALRSL